MIRVGRCVSLNSSSLVSTPSIFLDPLCVNVKRDRFSPAKEKQRRGRNAQIPVDRPDAGPGALIGDPDEVRLACLHIQEQTLEPVLAVLDWPAVYFDDVPEADPAGITAYDRKLRNQTPGRSRFDSLE